MADKRKVKTKDFEATGNGQARCTRCGWVGSANAYARFRHNKTAHDGPNKAEPPPVKPEPAVIVSEPVVEFVPLPEREFKPGGSHIRFAPLRTYPVGQSPPPLDVGDIPSFLRRGQK